MTHSRSSRPEVFYKKGVLRNFAKFIGKRLCQNLFFNKVAGLRLRIKEGLKGDYHVALNPREIWRVLPSKRLALIRK